MEDDQKMRDPQTCKIAMDLHLAKFNYFMAKKDWKAAVAELQLTLNAVIEILDTANKTLKKIAERYQQGRIGTTPAAKADAKVEGSIKTEKISEDTVLVEYPGDKLVLRRM